MKNGYQIIDAHCHIYPEKIAQKAVAGTDTFYGTTAKCLGTTADLFDQDKKCGIDHSLVQSVATTPKQVRSINQFIADEVNRSNSKLTGLGTLHPDSENLREDVENIISLGLVGVKLHPDIQKFKIDDYRCLKIYELCEHFHLPILMHTGDSRYDYSNPNRLLPVLKIYKNLTVIGAHFGGWSIWEEASKKLCDLENLYVDCSSTFAWVKNDTVLQMIRRYGAKRVLFGTDFPMWSPVEEVDRFFTLDLTDDEKRVILSENAKKVYNINI